MGFRHGFGRDSHAFLKNPGQKVCVIGGVKFEDINGLDADSDGDVVYHSLCHAISSIVQVSVLGTIAPKMCQEGCMNSYYYVLGNQS